MLQEIAPHVYHNEFQNPKPRETDLVTVFDGRGALLDGGRYPTVTRMRKLGVSDEDLVYLFSIDDTAFFLLWEVTDAVRGGLEIGPGGSLPNHGRPLYGTGWGNGPASVPVVPCEPVLWLLRCAQSA